MANARNGGFDGDAVRDFPAGNLLARFAQEIVFRLVQLATHHRILLSHPDG